MMTLSPPITLLIALMLAVCLFPDTAHANAALFDSGTNFLNAFLDLLTNIWAQIIGMIAVCCCGILWSLGRMQWAIASSVIGGLILMFGSAAIVDSVARSI